MILWILSMLDLDFFVNLVVVAFNFILAFVVYKNNSKSATNIFFSLLSISIICWLTTSYISLLPAFIDSSLFWIRLSIFFAVPIGLFLYLLSTNLPYLKIQIASKKLYILAVISLLVALVNLTPLSFRGVEIIDNSPSPIPGPGLVLFALLTLFFFTGGIYSLFVKIRTTKGLVRQQVKTMMYGILLMLGLIIVTIMIPLLVFRISFFVTFQPVYTMIFLGMTAYSIVKHRFMDLRLIVARTVSYSLLLFVIVLFYTFLIFTLTEFIPIKINPIYVYASMALVVAFSFNPLRSLLENLTDKFLFKGRYDTAVLLSKLTHIMASEIEMNVLTNSLLKVLTREMRITKGAFVLVKEHKLDGVHSVNFKNESEIHNEPWLEHLLHEKTDRAIVYEEIDDKKFKKTFRNLDITVGISLKVKGEEMGVLILGPKASGEIYSSQDLELLEIFAPQAAVALQNAQSYKEIQEFSKTLEKKVKERTKELRETQKRELKKANELLKLKDEFVFIATHDLRTPVTAIRGFLDIIQTSGEKFSEKTKENFKAVMESSNRLNQLVNDLLEVARSESGTIKVEVKPVDIVEIIKDTLKEIEPSAQKKNVNIETDMMKDKWMVMGDGIKLKEVMENLLSNGVKYNKEGGELKIKAKEEGEYLSVSVSDTGLGIPKEHQEQVFQKFFRSQTEKTKDIQGTGLGLFVVRMLIEKMKGTITFNSIEDVGTTFTFKLKLADQK